MKPHPPYQFRAEKHDEAMWRVVARDTTLTGYVAGRMETIAGNLTHQQAIENVQKMKRCTVMLWSKHIFG